MRKHAVLGLNEYNPKGANIIPDLTAEEVDELYFRINSKPLAEGDSELITRAFQLARERCLDKVCQTVCVARGRSGMVYTGLHKYARKGAEFSSCSENGVLHRSYDEDDSLVVFVTMHHSPPILGDTSTTPTIVPPCGLCREKFRRSHPESMVILERGGLFRFPVQKLLPCAYPIED